MFNLKRNKKSKGFTLIEILLVVGFIALAGIGVYIVYDKIQQANEINQDVRNMEVIAAGIQNLYASSPSYDGVTMATLVKAKIVPESMIGGPEDNPTVKTKTGFNNLNITTYPGMKRFTLNQSIPNDKCLQFVSAASKTAIEVTVGPSAIMGIVKDVSVPGKETLDVQFASERCRVAAANSIVRVGYK